MIDDYGLTVQNCIESLNKVNKTKMFVRLDYIRKINRTQRFTPSAIRSGVDFWIKTHLKKGSIKRINKGVYQIL